MGIYGLTSYVARHQSELLDECKLHNCAVLVDGNSAASLVYSNLTRSNHAFGGDYDRYAGCIRDFVQLLRKCDLTPIFVFDGGYEQRKFKTVLERIRMNIVICGQYKNKYRECKTFPLMLRDVFRAVLNELQVQVVQCDFEADNELVVLSRILRCPLISYDSDFCVTDARYVPFTTIDFRAVKFKKKSTRRKYYLPCKMFNVDKFLSRFGGPVDKTMLPLLSCALGNDYIPRNTFQHFLHLNHTTSFDERVTTIVRWMAKIVSVDEAVELMVSFIQNHKYSTKKTINHLLHDYNRTTCYLLDFIPEDIVETGLCPALEKFTIDNSLVTPEHVHESADLSLNSNFEVYLTDDEDEDCISCSDDDIIILETEEYEIPCSDEEDIIELTDESPGDPDSSTVGEPKIEDESKTYEPENGQDKSMNSIADDSLLNVTDFQTHINDSSLHLVATSEPSESSEPSEPWLCSRVPPWFLHKYRRGLLSPNLINVISSQRWFVPSQSEDYFGKPSHEISLPILQTVAGIVLGETAVTKVKCHARSKGIHRGVYDITPVFQVQAEPLPNLFSVTSIPAEARASILIDCLNLPKNMNLRVFPREWRLYMLILMYWKNHCKQPAANESHIRAAMLCLVYLSVIDSKVGFVRLASDLKRVKKEKRRSKKLISKMSNMAVSADPVQAQNSVEATEVPLLTDLPINSSKMEDSVSADPVQAQNSVDATEDPLLTDLPVNPSKVEDSVSADHVQVQNSVGATEDPLLTDANLPVNSSKVEDLVSADPVQTQNSMDATEDPLPTDLPVNSSKMEDSMSIDFDQAVCNINPPTAGLTSNPPEIIEDLPVDADQKSTDKSSPLADRGTLPADADNSVANEESILEDSGNELFANEGEYESVQDFLDLISDEDCYTSAMALMNYHQVNQTLLKNRKDFDLKLVHSLAQLQHCIQSICILNSVLDFPFVQCKPHSCFSGTFLYNVYSELNHRKLADGYITRTVLTKASTIIALYRYLISSWEAVTSKKVVRPKFNVKKKKKKGHTLPVSISDKPTEPELYHDPDNIYSMLPEE